ncbi:MAG: NADH-quinone oxidoreductase subunit NuoE [Myxococcales bacterium]|nr:MAG: NADH-quinone oxidoreductase subunit NuoE [Myxococcales bacterium]
MSNNVESVLQKHPDAGQEHLIPILQEVQEAEGYLSLEALRAIGKHLRVPVGHVFGVATFYNQFRFKPIGRHQVTVCRGTACHVKGSAVVLDTLKRELSIAPGETTEDGEFSLEVVACIGSCGLAPVITVNKDFHAGMSPAKVERVLKQYQKKGRS